MSAPLVYFGSDDFSSQVLRMVRAAGYTVSLVVTTPAQQKGRGLTVQKNPVERYCEAEGLAVISPPSLRDPALIQTLRAQHVDVFAVVSYGKIIPDEVLAIPSRMPINVHPSLLPRWRGASPMQSALLFGDAETGVSIIKVVTDVDAGDILMQQSMSVPDHIDEPHLAETLARMGGALLVESIAAIRDGSCVLQPQDPVAVTHARKFTKEDGVIDWTASAKDIHNRIRALCVWPTAYTLFRGKRLKVFSSTVSDVSVLDAAPGVVVRIDKNGAVYVATGDGVLALQDVQLEGKKRMPAFQFSLGTHLTIGDCIGE